MDDRKAFQEKAESDSKKLGMDTDILKKSIETMVELDRYNYTYLWTWLGLPIIQFPADIVATQEVIFKSKPNVIIETGVARGGSVVFLASMLKLLDIDGIVIGVDVDIRPHNREAILSTPLSKRIALIQGDSTEKQTLVEIEKYLKPDSRIMVILDSDHSKAHVAKELDVYSKLVSRGCYLIVADTILGHMNSEQTPRNRSKIWYKGNEPYAAVSEFLENNLDFRLDKVVNGKMLLSSSIGGFLVRD